MTAHVDDRAWLAKFLRDTADTIERGPEVLKVTADVRRGAQSVGEENGYEVLKPSGERSLYIDWVEQMP
jgi:hypothetical protein